MVIFPLEVDLESKLHVLMSGINSAGFTVFVVENHNAVVLETLKQSLDEHIV